MTQRLSHELAKLDDEALNRLYMRVFNTPDGQILLEDLRVRCYVYDTTFRGNADETLVNEGMRSVIVSIETRLASAPAETKEEA